MAEFPIRLLEMFGNGFYNVSAGLANIMPGTGAKERAYGIATTTTLERVIKDLGASCARELAAEMLNKKLRPADHATDPNILEMTLKRIQLQLKKEPELFYKSLSYYLSNVG